MRRDDAGINLAAGRTCEGRRKVGDIVTIFEDPWSQKKPEGKARLIKRTRILDPALEYWEVQFEGEECTHWRWIKKEAKL